MATIVGFRRYQIWLISSEGFSPEASNLTRRRSVFTSSRQQSELLAARLSNGRLSPTVSSADADEFIMVLPMGEDNELVPASAVQQIARRLTFRQEALNQIKTAIVEACINASEHSFSPDRKIYQRFRVESDRLVVTIRAAAFCRPMSG